MSQQRLRRIAGVLITVLLGTLLSPSFGWETATSAAAHEHHVLMSGIHDSGAGHHQDDEDSHHHLGCAGHMLGHLPAQMSAAFVFFAMDLTGDYPPEAAFYFSSNITERFPRPPALPA